MLRIIFIFLIFCISLSAELHPKVMEVLEEKSIENYEGEVYRFIWLRTWEKPIVIRVELTGEEEGRLLLKQTDGVGGYGLKNYGKVLIQEKRKLSVGEVKAFQNVLIENKFWDTKYVFDPPPPDGSYWRIEGLKDERKHLLERITPSEGVVYNVGVQFLFLTSLPVKQVYKKEVLEKKRRKLQFIIYSILGILFIIGICIYYGRKRKV